MEEQTGKEIGKEREVGLMLPGAHTSSMARPYTLANMSPRAQAFVSAPAISWH